MDKKYSKEYEEYSKSVIDKYIEMCTVKHDYNDYCGLVQGNDYSTYYNFRQANTYTLLDMLHNRGFERKGVNVTISDRLKHNQRWLEQNHKTYDEWLKDKL